MADTYQTFVIGSELAAGTGGLSSLASTMATLVADGATPTQAHVTAANTALQGITGATQAALLVNVDTTRVPTVSVLRALLNQVLGNAAASGMAP